MSLAAQNLSLSLSGVPLLDGINLEVKPGQITTVLGPNGAGKTSLLRVLVGELAPQAGSVTLSGRDLKSWSPVQRARMLAVLPQHSLLNFPFSAAEVVMLGRTPHDTGAVYDRDIVHQTLKAVDGDYLAQRFYTQLSGGEKQRVQLARVLAQIWEPSSEGDRYLVLDEPTSSLDLAHQQMTLDVVRNLAQKGVGIMIVIHDLNLAARCADQMLLLQCGRIVISGTPQDVLKPENIHSVFQVDAHIGRHPVSGTPLVIT
ncbi:MAG TPA: heme ABC transporter ATP-binding protein [Halieaceae bacterium]|nr:MAG: heme ABC transporter ATP-binding protein [Gammaproteobacteria bacterium]HDY83597.1 heme ABC transporter ATP-binding protein [Halieaceae bacterium]